MPNLFKGVVKLTEDQYKTLLKGGSFDFNGQTIVYDVNTLYVTDYSIDGELDVNSLNPVTNRAIALALNDKAGKEEIPANVVTTNTEQDIEGNKNFVGNVTKNGVNLATVEDIKVTDTLDHQYDDYALSVKGGMVLNDKITTLIENVNGRVQSFSLNSLNDLLTLFNITTNTDEAMEQYPVSTKNITYMDKEYTLKTGDIFLIVDTDVPDYWFSTDTMMLYKMETMKVDLTNYATIDFVTNSVKNKAEQSSLNATNQNVASNTSEIATLKANQKTKLSEMASDEEHRTVTDSQINMWDNKIDEVDLEGYATEEYVNQNGGKIDKIYLNDVEQEIVNKEVHLEIEIPEVEQITDYYKVGNKLTGIDLNTIVVPGNYGVANDCTNMPISENGTLFVGEYDKGTYVQQLFISSSNKVYSRSSTSVDNSTWNAWELMAKDSKFDGYLSLNGGTLTNDLTLDGSSSDDNRATLRLVSKGNNPTDLMFGSNGAHHWSITSRDTNTNLNLMLYNYDLQSYVAFVERSTNVVEFTKRPRALEDDIVLSGDLSNYLPLSGGKIITGSFTLGDKVGIRSSDSKNLISCFTTDKVIYVGETDKTLYLQGVNDRPTYINGSGVSKNIALSTDVPSLSGYATETYVNNAIKDLIGSAPDTLNTLEELATAIGNNKDIVDGLGDTYVPLSGSKAMTGKLNAPKGITVGAQASGGSGDNEIGIDFGTYSKLSARDGLIGVYANGDIALRPYYDSNTSNGVKITETTLYPTRNATMDLGTSTYKFKNIYASGTSNLHSAKISSYLALNNEVRLCGYDTNGNTKDILYYANSNNIGIGNDTAKLVSFSPIQPASYDDNLLDLGTATARWKDLYIYGNLHDGTNYTRVADIKKKYTWKCTISGAAGWYRVCNLSNGITGLKMTHYYAGSDETIQFGQVHIEIKTVNCSGYNKDDNSIVVMFGGYTNSANKISSVRKVVKGNGDQYLEVYKGSTTTMIFDIETDNPVKTKYTSAPSGDTIPDGYSAVGHKTINYDGRMIGTVSNAHRDSAGNIISETYLKKTGGTLTGNITIQAETNDTLAFGSANPAITFANENGDQKVSILYNDHDTLYKPASINIVGQQGGEYLVAPNIKATSDLYVNGKLKVPYIYGTDSSKPMIYDDGTYVVAGNASRQVHFFSTNSELKHNRNGTYYDIITKYNIGSQSVNSAHKLTGYNQMHAITGSGGNPKWVKLGTLSSTSDNHNTIIRVYSGNGYNGGTHQNSDFEIHIKDGYQNPTSTTKAFGCTVYGNNSSSTTQGQIQVKIMAQAHNSCDVWCYLPWGWWNGGYTVDTQSVWTHSLQNGDDYTVNGGVEQEVEIRNIFSAQSWDVTNEGDNLNFNRGKNLSLVIGPKGLKTNGALGASDGLITGEFDGTQDHHAIKIGVAGRDYCEFLEYGGDFRFIKRVDGTSTTVATITQTGITSHTGYFNAASDKRLKENIIDIDENSLKSFIENTPIKAFNYKSNGNRTVGVIAQDIENLEIDGAKFTSTNEDGYLQVHETKFVYLLWNYCQQLNRRIKELESKVK